MKTLVYVSAAKVLPAEAELDALLHEACANNARHAIAGMLLYCDGTYMQAIEGPDEAVARLFEAILADPRHHQVTPILAIEDGAPSFADWTMGYRRAAPMPDPCFLSLAGDGAGLRSRLSNASPPARLLHRFLVANRVVVA